MEYTCYLISNKPYKFPLIAESIKPIKLNYWDGTDTPSFAKLVNTCVAACPTETVIIMGDKTMPIADNVYKVLDKLSQGYAFVALYSFGFFGLTKELFRRIGPLDERYTGGGFEDYDFYCRLVEADLAVYSTSEVLYWYAPNTWSGYCAGGQHWATKWYHKWTAGELMPDSISRTIPEETYSYDWGKSTNQIFLSNKEHSYVDNNPHVSPFFKIPIRSMNE